MTEIIGKERAEKFYESAMAELRKNGLKDEDARYELLQAVDSMKKFAGLKQVVDEQNDKLLTKTDHKAVLEAAREVIRTRQEFKRDPKWHGGTPRPDISFIAATDPRLPDAIRELGAISIFANDKYVRIEFGGGMYHHGFVAFSESATNVNMQWDGYCEIIKGLWFYEDIM